MILTTSSIIFAAEIRKLLFLENAEIEKNEYRIQCKGESDISLYNITHHEYVPPAWHEEGGLEEPEKDEEKKQNKHLNLMQTHIS